MRTRMIWAALALLALMAPGAPEATAGKPPPPPPPTPADPAIAFTWSGSLKVMNADGTNQVVLVAATAVRRQTAGVTCADPDWSPDGTQIVFASNVDAPNGGGHGVYVVNRDGTGRHKTLSPIASPLGIWGLTPAWSPAPVPGTGGDRQRIAYAAPAAPGGLQHLWIADVDGSNAVDLGGAAAGDALYPTWSPLGTRLACSIYGTSTRDTYALIDFAGDGVLVSGTYPAPLAGHDVGRPSWSKTREDVMLVEATLDWPSVSPGKFDLWRLDPTTVLAPPVNLTGTATLNEYHGSYSPDDARVVYQEPGVGLKVMNADGSNRTLISSSGMQPSWRRNP